MLVTFTSLYKHTSLPLNSSTDSEGLTFWPNFPNNGQSAQEEEEEANILI
jgi:hypothetical protein